MYKNHLQKGIVLITTLFIIGFLVMFAGAIVVTTRRQATMTNQFYYRETALFAAQTGINYALMRLSSNPYWMGCEYKQSGTGADYTLTMDNGAKVDIREHAISGNQGVVEGKIDGGEAGYFDLYFVKPNIAKGSMLFFGDPGLGKVPLPTKIPLCNNRNNQLTDPPLEPGATVPGSWAMYSDDTYYKPTPQNSVILVCRGVMGREQRIVEVCVRLGAGEDFNSVAIGRGDITINLDPNGKLILKSMASDKPPFIRTKGSIIVGNGSSVSTDYLDVKNDGGGRASGTVSFTPVPSKNYDTFQGNVNISDAAYPPLQFSPIIPKMDSFSKIDAGYYKIKPVKGKLPNVEYFPTDDPSKVANGSVTPIKDGTDTLSRLLRDGTIKWDEKNLTMELHKPLKVNGVSASGDMLKDLQIVGPTNDYILLELKSVIDAKRGKFNHVYLVNNIDGGNIKLDTGLAGVGTVITKGSLQMIAESQLSAVEDTGISIYAMGDIIINPIRSLPKNIQGTSILDYDDKVFLRTLIDSSSSRYLVKNYNYPGGYRETKWEATNPGNDGKILFTEAEWNLLKALGLVQTLTSQGGLVYELTDINVDDLQRALDIGVKFTGTNQTGADGAQIQPKDCQFKGLIFTCNNFIIRNAGASFKLVGGLVAYGGDPGTGSAYSGSGNITINCKTAEFTYDTKYLSIFQALTSKKVETLYWASY